jgi:hypothetical protein
MKKQSKEVDELADRVRKLLAKVIRRYHLDLTNSATGPMGAWQVKLESSEFIVCAGRDRGDEVGGITVGSKIRRRPRAQMRGPWSLCHLRGYLDDMKDYYLFQGLEEQASWLEQNADELFDSTLLNSDDLNSWAVNASRRWSARSRMN